MNASAHADSLFILADDLTGAADCAIGAARDGLTSVVLLEPGGDGAIEPQAQVVSVDADTRHRPAGVARAIDERLWRAHARPGRLLYKKIDSTLRGPFAAEMAGLVDAGVAIVAPAFPATGRVTRNGRVFVHDVPLERTEIWANEAMRGEADLVAMLRAQGLAAESVPVAELHGAARDAIARRVTGGGVRALVFDAESDADLAAIAAATVGLPVYWVGSAGLAAHLPRAAGIAGGAPPPVPVVDGPILVVVGSLSAVSRTQAQALRARTALVCLEAPPDVLSAGEGAAGWAALRDAVAGAAAEGRDILVAIGTSERNDLSRGQVLSASLARALLPAMPRVGALIATGGETARAVLSAVGVRALQVLREVEPGVALSVTLGARSMPVVTKAGAFGSPNALRDAYDELAIIRRRDPSR